MKRFTRFVSRFLLIVFILSSMVQVVLADSSSGVIRIGGKNRVETAIDISKKAYKKEVSNLFIAGYNGEADALTATSMAGAFDGPLLISDKKEMSSKLLEEIKRLNPKKIFILGGEKSFSKDIEKALNNRGYSTQRLKGNSRVETAINIAKENHFNGKVDEIFVVEYSSLVDALAIGPVAVKTNSPVLISRKDTTPDQLAKFLKDWGVKKITIIGGENTISKKGMNDLKKHVSKVERISGNNRIETSIKIANKYFKEPNTCFVANGWKNADALIGGYFAGMEDSPILLSKGNVLDRKVGSFIKDIPNRVFVLGGSSVINSSVFNEIKTLLTMYDQLEAEVLRLTNVERTKNGLKAFTTDKNLAKVARLKSKDMVDNNYFAHQSPTYGSPFDMLQSFNISYGYAAENIAAGHTTAKNVVKGWMDSPGHRDNILNPNLKKLGVGAYNKLGGRLYWTQIFTD